MGASAGAAPPPPAAPAELMSCAEALRLLGLKEGASAQQVRAAYKARLLRLHPDKQAGRAARGAKGAAPGASGEVQPAAAAAFHRLQAAYRLLTAPPEAQAFDALVAAGAAFGRGALDEAVLQGLGPADVAYIQETVEAFEAAAASGGPLPPTPPPEELQLWRRLHKSAARRRRREEREAALREAAEGAAHQQRGERGLQSAGGAAAAAPAGAWASLLGMLSDLLLATPGGVWVPEDLGDGEGAPGPARGPGGGLEVAAPATPPSGAERTARGGGGGGGGGASSSGRSGGEGGAGGRERGGTSGVAAAGGGGGAGACGVGGGGAATDATPHPRQRRRRQAQPADSTAPAQRSGGQQQAPRAGGANGAAAAGEGPTGSALAGALRASARASGACGGAAALGIDAAASCSGGGAAALGGACGRALRQRFGQVWRPRTGALQTGHGGGGASLGGGGGSGGAALGPCRGGALGLPARTPLHPQQQQQQQQSWRRQVVQGLSSRRPAPATAGRKAPPAPAAAPRLAAPRPGVPSFAARPLLRPAAPGGARRYSAAAAAAAAAGRAPAGALAGAAEAAAAGWGGLMSWASEGVWAGQAAILNALNLAGGHLPKAIALLFADWVNNSALASGARGEPPVEWAFVVERAGAGAPPPAGAPWWRRAGGAAATATAAAWGGAAFAARLCWLTLLFAPLAAAAPFALQWGWRRRQWMELLRMTLEAAGPAWVKWGQWSATRHDLFPPDMCAALEVLHAAAPAHAFRDTDAAITRAFGLPAAEVFEWLEEEPLASGSIGQVHRARLSAKGAALTGCAPGSLVAVKVRHPHVSDAIERDFQAMVWLAGAAGALIPAARALRLEDTLKQFEAPLHEQVDLSREARNLARFNRNFRRTRAVSFPTPLYPLVAPDVLVESFEAGRHITAYIATSGAHPYSHRLAELGSGTMLQMMLVDNLIHSDLHPGNILVRLEPPSGLLGLAHAALSKLLDATAAGGALCGAAGGGGALCGAAGGGGSGVPSDGGSGEAAGGGGGECGGAKVTGREGGVPACGSSSRGDAADAVAASSSPRELVVPAVQSIRARGEQRERRAAAAAAGGGSGGGGAAAALGRGPLREKLDALRASWLQPRIVLLDVGMATELSREDQTNMVGLFRAFSQMEGADAADWVLRFSGPQQACAEPEAFRRDMARTFAEIKAQDEDSDNASFDSGADALAAVLEHVRSHGVSLPGHICAVVVTTLVLEGWSNKLDPEFSVLSQVQGMFEPATRAWHERICHSVDLVMERGDAGLAMA
ncbi:MAG: hypothetical protein J3K34DRAFT_459528 [Monoraphidium minutum]|nr:MAG: hypothetical protein J3K34DRAFT_459528 [Monoraphidium minutum]